MTMDPQQNRIEFALLFDATLSNPNGDPDAGNVPRQDVDGYGLVTDTCLKRKVRDHVVMQHAGKPGLEIYVKVKGVLHDENRRAYAALGRESAGKRTKGANKHDADVVDQARRWMCQTFYDVRTFGAVMSTGVNAGQVRGPVQMTMAISQDPVAVVDIAGNRVAAVEARNAKGDELPADADHDARDDRRNSRPVRTAYVRYGLYRCHGFVTPAFARQTGFERRDLDVLVGALSNLFAYDKARVRPNMTVRRLVFFDHSSPLGDMPSHDAFASLSAVRKCSDPYGVRSYDDYTVKLDVSRLKDSVRAHEVV